ncbi:uncharacterized protein LOC112465030 [Temnothorax curvispinosus]|uniref:Uncharacterized protein LOC112465030 n=1 Tax=Temnothorax curvispinosus TaxID=300111 RepID=A0A6J1R0L1_9HYME|nr:uncharacterized protein LOC112465030 [Temnothorax curvispinosus]
MGNACFAWSVVTTLHPAERHAERKSSYPHYTSVLNLTDIKFPMTLDQIKNFENHNISINVYSIKKKNKELAILPIRLTDQKMDRHVNLLYMHDDNVGHFAWIKNLTYSALCLHYFLCTSSSEKLEAHTVDCREMNDCAIKLPSDNDKWLAFKNPNRKERVPFIVYADLECTLEKMEADPETSRYTHQHHRVFSMGYYVHCSYDESLSMYRFRRDKDCVAWFAKELRRLTHDYMLPLYCNKCKVTYSDTDSLIYHIECDDVYDTMKRYINRFDTSDYAIDHAYGIKLANKKVPGLMKDENNGAIMTEFVGLRAKMYALRVDGKKDTKKAKSVKCNVVARGEFGNDPTSMPDGEDTD